MTTGANSYGTAVDVASLTRRFTSNGIFDSTTNPTLATVERWIDTVSATMNVCLAAAGFAIPVAQADAKTAIAGVVIEAVADLVHAANSAGRFFTDTALERGVSPTRVIRKEMNDWVTEQADGLELLGAVRTRAATAGILFRDTDEACDEIFPIFQRKGFENEFTDWTG